MWIGLLTLLGCGSGSNPTPPPAAPPQAAAPRPDTPRARVDLSAGQAWGAVLWKDGAAYWKGGGAQLFGAAGALDGAASGEAGPCGRPVSAPPGAVLALPTGGTAQAPPRAPGNQASVLERAAWRLDELLPARDVYAPALPDRDPSHQRGVTVGSLVKTRREGAPPVLVASGVRDCVAAVALLSADAASALAADEIPKQCTALTVLPPGDYDGDGTREFALTSPERVLLYRLDETQDTPALVRLADWSCGPG